MRPATPHRVLHHPDLGRPPPHVPRHTDPRIGQAASAARGEERNWRRDMKRETGEEIFVSLTRGSHV